MQFVKITDDLRNHDFITLTVLTIWFHLDTKYFYFHFSSLLSSVGDVPTIPLPSWANYPLVLILSALPSQSFMDCQILSISKEITYEFSMNSEQINNIVYLFRFYVILMSTVLEIAQDAKIFL